MPLQGRRCGAAPAAGLRWVPSVFATVQIGFDRNDHVCLDKTPQKHVHGEICGLALLQGLEFIQGVDVAKRLGMLR